MRNSVGDEIIVCDNNSCFNALISDILNEKIICDLGEKLENFTTFYCDIAQALIRRERFEYMVQKSSELGVHHIIPTIMKHSIVKINQNKQEEKVLRWNKIAKEASEQSHRFFQAVVKDVYGLSEIPYQEYDLVLVAYEKEKGSIKLKDVLVKPYHKILVVIGPEGGFDPSEIAFLEDLDNSVLVGLGPRILRSETASSYILSVLSYAYEF